MGLKQRYEYSPIEEILFPKKSLNSQYDETIDESSNGKLSINTIRDNIMKQHESLDICLKHKEKYLNTKNTKSLQNYFFFYEYRKCIFNLDGKMFIDKNSIPIKSDPAQRDQRLNELPTVENYNTFIYAYNI